MRIGYMSDIHLEFTEHLNYRFDARDHATGGDVLIIAGDLLSADMIRQGRTDKEANKLRKYLAGPFKQNVVDKYEYVLYVIGNHEHYRSIFKHTKRTIQDGLAELGLQKLWIIDNNLVKLNGVVFYGGTLWTDFNKNDDFSKFIVQNGMNDYKLIGLEDVDDMNYYNRNSNRKITTDFILNQHDITKQYIIEISKQHVSSGDKKVVITHMAPTWKSLNSLHIGSSLDPAYASDLEQLIFDCEIDYWIHGHTHQSCEYQVGPCTVLSNQRGYYMEQSCKEFQGIKHLDI